MWMVKKKGGGDIPFYFNTNYCTEMKLVPINMDYCLLQFDALKIFLPASWGVST